MRFGPETDDDYPQGHLRRSCVHFGKKHGTFLRGVVCPGADLGRPGHGTQPPDKPRIAFGTIGAISELVAAVDLMRRGYHVFRALSPNCPSDLLIYRAGTALRVQVRTAQIRDPKARILDFPLKDHDQGTFDMLALVVEDDGVYYLPALPSDEPQQRFWLRRHQFNRLQRWGVLRGAAQMEDADDRRQEVVDWPPEGSGKRWRAEL